jgi:hypothetical protein
MHVTKNVFDNIIGTLLDMPRKMKDGLKSCNDLLQFGLRPEVHPILRPNGKHYLPTASYSLRVEEKKVFYQCLRGVPVPTGFSSNITKLVSVKDFVGTLKTRYPCVQVSGQDRRRDMQITRPYVWLTSA